MYVIAGISQRNGLLRNDVYREIDIGTSTPLLRQRSKSQDTLWLY